MAFQERRQINPQCPVHAFEAKNLIFPAHWHEEAEMVIVFSGSIEFTMDRKVYRLGQGEAALAAPGIVHGYQGPDSRCLIFIFPHRVSVTGEPFDPEPSPLKSQIITLSDPEYPALARIAELGLFVIDPARRKSPGKATMLAALTQLSRGIFSCSENRTGETGEVNPSSAPVRKQASGNSTRMRRALGYMEQNFTRPLSLEEVAKAAGLSECHFSRQFHRYAGAGFTAWLTSRRLAEAERLLAHSDFSILDIADEAGFSGMRALDRAFQSRRGMSPREYRAALEQDY